MVRFATQFLVTALLTASVASAQSASQVRAAVPESTAAADVFIKIPDIEGEATKAGHEGWIEVQSLQFGKPGILPTGPGTLTLTKRADRASAPLSQRCSAKRSFREVLLHMPSNQRGQYTEYVLQNVTLSSCNQERATESLSLNFEKVSTRTVSRSTSR